MRVFSARLQTRDKNIEREVIQLVRDPIYIGCAHDLSLLSKFTHARRTRSRAPRSADQIMAAFGPAGDHASSCQRIREAPRGRGRWSFHELGSVVNRGVPPRTQQG